MYVHKPRLLPKGITFIIFATESVSIFPKVYVANTYCLACNIANKVLSPTYPNSYLYAGSLFVSLIKTFFGEANSLASYLNHPNILYSKENLY